MRPDKILFIDTETGGIDPAEGSLLSLAMVVWKEFEIVDSIEILINDGILKATPRSLEINGIDLEQHRLHALTPEKAIARFDGFLSKHFTADEKITLGGHNINFDVNFLRTFLGAHQYPYHHRFSHRTIDTASILFYLYLTGKIKKKIVSSQDAFDYFGIPVEGRHTALGDAVATAHLFTDLIRILYRDNKTAHGPKDSMPELF